MGAWRKITRRTLLLKGPVSQRDLLSPHASLFAEVPPNELPSIHLPSFFGTSAYLGYTLITPQGGWFWRTYFLVSYA